MPKLTEKLIVRTVYKGPNHIIWDNGLHGFGLLVGKTRKSFVVQHDHRPRKVFGQYPNTSLKLARSEAKAYLSQMERGIDPWAPNKSDLIDGMSFRELFDEWIREPGERTGKRKRRKTIVDATNCFRFNLDSWMKRSWQSITVADCRDKYQEIANGHINTGSQKIGTVNRARQTLAYARAVIGLGLDKYDIDRSNPVSKLPSAWMNRPVNDDTAESHRCLTDDELRLLGNTLTQWPGSNPLHPLYIRLMFYTALRIETMIQLQWSMVNDGELLLPGTIMKNHRMLRVPITKPIQNVLDELLRLPREEETWLFAGATQSGAMSDGGWPAEKARTESGVKFSAHDARYTFATIGERLGFSDRVVGSLLGHVSTTRKNVTHIYQDIDGIARLNAITAINKHLQANLQ